MTKDQDKVPLTLMTKDQDEIPLTKEEFERWFLRKVQEALDDNTPLIPHEVMLQEVAKRIEANDGAQSNKEDRS